VNRPEKYRVDDTPYVSLRYDWSDGVIHR
jgi:hypothetical protein